MKTITQRNAAIDLAKYIASIFIIGIHTGFFSDINQTLAFVFQNIIFRTAVPFFAVCTGFFLLPRLCDTKKRNRSTFFGHEKKLIIMYAVWSGLYLLYSIPQWLRTGWFSAAAFLDYFVAALQNGSHYHLWYLLGMIYALPIAYLILPYLTRRKALISSGVLYLIWLLFYSYRWLLPKSIGQIFCIMDYSFAASAAVFLLLPLMLLGWAMNGVPDPKRRNSRLGLLFSLGLLTIEAFFINNKGYDKCSYLIFSYSTACFLFQAIKGIRLSAEKMADLGKISMIVYCVHPMIVEVLIPMGQGSLAVFLETTLIATLIGLGYSKLKRVYYRRRKPCSN